MSSVAEILNAYGKVGVDLLKEKVSAVRATGKTEASIRYEVEEKDYNYSLKIFGRNYFKALETGRGPIKNSTYGEFDKHLEEWLEVKSSETKTSKSGIKYYKLGNTWFSGKSLAHKINKEGDKTYRSGGREVYSNDLDKYIEEVKKESIRAFITSIQIVK